MNKNAAKTIKYRYKLIVLACCMGFHAYAENSTSKNLFSLAAGTVLALVGHNLLELAATFVHEMGHALTNTMLTGDPIKIALRRTPGPLAIVVPWQGATEFRTNLTDNSVKEALRTAAGPVAGLTTAQLQFYAIARLQRALHGKQEYTASPFSF